MWQDRPWIQINDPSDHRGAAAYRVALVSSVKPFRAVPIPRLLGVDKEGILSIGMTGNMEARRKQFRRGSHSEGILLKIIKKYSAFNSVFKDTDLAYQFVPRTDRDDSIRAERKEIKRYVMRFGEVPPLNSAIPDRHNSEEWKTLFDGHDFDLEG